MLTKNDHTFVITVHGDNPYLEECIISLKNQTISSNIVISTSTPSETLYKCASKYDVPVYVATGSGSIASNWNFALTCADTKLITLAHQDDIYKSNYTEKMLDCLNKSNNPIIFFSGYSELRGTQETKNNLILIIKKILLFPISISNHSKLLRRFSLSMGCAICCPSVTFVKSRLDGFSFDDTLPYDLDWDTWERLSKLDGDFVYCKDALMVHRIHESSETTKGIGTNARTKEDYILFKRFWPKSIAKLLSRVYSLSEKSNS